MAEEIKNETNEEVVKDNTEQTVVEETKKPTTDELMLELVKLKKAQEKAASEAAEYKKKYRASLSEKEQADLLRAESEAAREEEFNALKRENAINKLEKNFISLGYSNEQAMKAATAQFDSDTDTLFSIQKEVQEAQIKAEHAKWLNSIPPVATGTGDGGTITLEQFNNMSLVERSNLYNTNRELYNQLSKN